MPLLCQEGPWRHAHLAIVVALLKRREGPDEYVISPLEILHVAKQIRPDPKLSAFIEVNELLHAGKNLNVARRSLVEALFQKQDIAYMVHKLYPTVEEKTRQKLIAVLRSDPSNNPLLFSTQNLWQDFATAMDFAMCTVVVDELLHLDVLNEAALLSAAVRLKENRPKASCGPTDEDQEIEIISRLLRTITDELGVPSFMWEWGIADYEALRQYVYGAALIVECKMGALSLGRSHWENVLNVLGRPVPMQ